MIEITLNDLLNNMLLSLYKSHPLEHNSYRKCYFMTSPHVHKIIVEIFNGAYSITYYVNTPKIAFKYEYNREYISFKSYYFNIINHLPMIKNILISFEDYTQQSLPDVWWGLIDILVDKEKNFAKLLES